MLKKLTDGGAQIIRPGKNGVVVLGRPVNDRQKEHGNKVDILFVIDTTGSMNDKIEALLETCRQFVDEPRKLNLDPQFALVSFGDILVEGGGDRIDIVFPLTGDVERIKYGLTHIPRNDGFGNGGESCLEAIEKALTIQCRDEAVKVLILITDDHAHQYRLKADQMTAILKQKEYLVFVIALPDQYYKRMALENGGTWKEISATSSLSDILDIFQKMAKKVAQVVEAVRQIGSVKEYIARLPPPKD